MIQVVTNCDEHLEISIKYPLLDWITKYNLLFFYWSSILFCFVISLPQMLITIPCLWKASEHFHLSSTIPYFQVLCCWVLIELWITRWLEVKSKRMKHQSILSGQIMSCMKYKISLLLYITKSTKLDKHTSQYILNSLSQNILYKDFLIDKFDPFHSKHTSINIISQKHAYGQRETQFMLKWKIHFWS